MGIDWRDVDGILVQCKYNLVKFNPHSGWCASFCQLERSDFFVIIGTSIASGPSLFRRWRRKYIRRTCRKIKVNYDYFPLKLRKMDGGK